MIFRKDLQQRWTKIQTSELNCAPETGWQVRSASVNDAADIAAIYNYYVLNTVVTFEEKAVAEVEMAARIQDVEGIGLPWIVAEQTGRGIAGYAYATRWKTRAAYKYSVEVTVYTAHDYRGRGLGSALYTQLFARLKSMGIHAAVGGIALPNEASVALHEKFGMIKVAQFREIGYKAEQWLDVGYWEKLF